jgi:exodeoxyribonuclease VII large subunit
MIENKIFSVTQISRLIKEIIENTFGTLRVRGEISNFKKAQSGHIYFDLKDENAVIPAVLFRGYSQYLQTKLENGLSVTITADITTYIKQGKYQLIVRAIEIHQQGDLYLKFEKLKNKLQQLGYFDENRKKPIPQYPKCIGIITSVKGAALRDILSILKSRHPNLEVIVAHASMQGQSAKTEIAGAIKDLNKYKKIDAILLGRGGGSMEDLWAFNEEIVVKAIFSSKIPIISCVGHETDFTIADFVSDMRAPTPSAAAQMIVKNQTDIIDSLVVVEKRLIKSIEMFYERQYFKVEKLISTSALKNPDILWQNKAQMFDRLYEELINLTQDKLAGINEKLNLSMGKLKTLNPTGILKRGYSIVRHNDKIISTSKSLQKKDNIEVEFHKGKIIAEVTAKGV